MARASMVKKSGLISNDFPHVLRGVCCFFFVGGSHKIHYMGICKKSVTPKWMVYNGKPYEQMDDLGVPLFLETSI